MILGKQKLGPFWKSILRGSGRKFRSPVITCPLVGYYVKVEF